MHETEIWESLEMFRYKKDWTKSPEARAELILKMGEESSFYMNYPTCITEHVGRGPAQLNMISW